MKPLAIINIAGLSDQLIGEHTPNLTKFPSSHHQRPIKSVLPAVTCSVQASILTGKQPSDHGIVGNGWYFRDLSEVWFWRQSNALIQGPKFWDAARERRPDLKVAKVFWWYNMYSSADIALTPRPSYPADGRKIPDIYTEPPELRDELQRALGQFPLFKFWGPLAGISSTDWISKSAQLVYDKHKPDLTLIYLPHLDYNLQRLGPDDPAISKDLREVDTVAGQLMDFFQDRDCEIAILSEYAILPVSRPVHLNRILRKEGFLRVQHNYVGELLDCGACRAFAVADHQIAHVYIQNREDISAVKKLLESVEGVAAVLDEEGKREWGIHHERSGELVAIAEKDSWFTYYYWLDDSLAPDFARTVDIHRKPGYDPVELFFDPDISLLKLKLIGKLIKKKLGFSTLMDVISLKPELVKGSHGLITESPDPRPVFMSNFRNPPENLSMTDLYGVFLERLLG